MSTTRTEILSAIVTRLQAIRIADGFDTDAGDVVSLGEPQQLGEDDPEAAIVVAFGEDGSGKAGPAYLVTAPLLIHAVAKASLEGAWEAIELILGDIKRAIELEDRRLGGILTGDMVRGSASPFPREPGSLTVGVTLTYSLQWKEGWGLP